MQWCTVAGTMAELELNSSSYIRSESFTNGESPLLNDTAVDLDEEDVSLDSLNRRILDDDSLLLIHSPTSSLATAALDHSYSSPALHASYDSSPLFAIGTPGTPLTLLSSPLGFSTPQAQPDDSITMLSQRSCCTQRCLAHLSLVEVERSRKWFDSMPDRSRQNQFLLDSYHISGSASSNTPTSTVNILEGKQLCKQAYISVLGISTKRYDRLHHQFRDGVMHYSRKPFHRRETSKVCLHACL